MSTAPAAGQSLATGSASLPAWSRAFGHSKPMSYPLDRMFGMIVGEQNAGKSFLLQSNPDALIINTDLSGTVNPKVKATLWPGIGPDGMPIDVDGKSMDLTWPRVEAMRQKLLKAAEQNQPRPKVVVIDTFSSALLLLRKYIPQTFGGKTDWNELDGRAAWERMNEILLEFCFSLRRAGYGVWIVVHVGREWQKIDEERATEYVFLRMPPSIRNTLQQMVEIIVPVVATTSIETVMVPTTIQKGTQTITTTRAQNRTVVKRMAAFNDPRLAGVVRTRTMGRMPDVVLDTDEPWASLQRAYDEVRTVADGT